LQIKPKGALGMLASDVFDSLLAFRAGSRFTERGGVVTDLDGTALHEREGRVYVAEPVAEGLGALADLGRPVVVNTLRFPLNVVRTFGREWSSITRQPAPLVSLNGAVFGLLTPVGESQATFEELAAFPLSAAELEAAAARVEELMAEGLRNLSLFIYPRDWQAGEIVWTPEPGQVDYLRAKYLSASDVVTGSPEAVRRRLLSHGACMVSIQVEIPQDHRMAYQHVNPSRFVTSAGVDKLSGAREAAARLDFDLGQSVGAGDTPMDTFLQGVGLAAHVGPMELDLRGRLGTVRLRDPFELGAALFELARLDEKAVAE
jgi:hydroxymethylpyrimidine pyrophosphatase-like HAD family hydrolase